jgi:hypothetical protein
MNNVGRQLKLNKRPAQNGRNKYKEPLDFLHANQIRLSTSIAACPSSVFTLLGARTNLKQQITKQ